jgi:pectin methylesterase-like acyl-CoA thioesterase
MGILPINAQFEAETVDNQTAIATFPFELGTEGQTATFNSEAQGWFKNSYVEHGDNLILKDANSGQTRFQPVINNDGSANDGNAITFYIIPKDGLTFTPTKASFKTTRYGTDGGKVDVSWVSSDLTAISLAKAISPARNNATPKVTEWSGDITGATASDGLCGLRLNLYSLGNTKQVGFADIVIEGLVNGTTKDVKQCKLVVTLQSDEAGKLTVTPNADVFSQGDEVTLAVQENFGWHFAAWVNAEGETVSTNNPYTFTIEDDTHLTATFDHKAIYALNLKRSEGVNDNLVQYAPTGNVIDGVHYYEEGTDVKLTAINNRILTFTGWEGDAQGTEQECELKMTGEKNVTANFSAADYIVGWDLYYDQPSRDRAADYKADSENAGMLTLRKADGATTSWLTRGIGNGQENGKFAARIWKNLSEEWYWEISFSSKGYENLSISSCIGDDYNTYSINNVQYSIDGETFTTIGTFNPPARGWDGPKEFALPAEANDQQRVWIRWMPDRTSPKIGVESDYDGTSIAEIFVLAELSGAADQQATLVSSTPAEGANDVSANGSIILNFDNKVKMGTAAATLAATALDGSAVETLTPIISGKSAIFKYGGLKYNTAYTFTMPEGVLTSRSGNPVAAVTLTFTTMERKQPEMRLYDAIVDAAAVSSVGGDGIATYTTVQAAIDAAPEGRAKPWLIFIMNGQYKEHVDIPKTKPYIHLIGQNRDNTVILDDRMAGGPNAQHVSVAATVVVNANNCFFENLTMENSYGHEQQAGPQALALNTIGDRIALNGVALLSYQDTWITTSTQKNRHYIKNSLIEGAVDFIYNGGDVYLDGDTLEINRPSGGYIVAPWHTADTKWGYVFQNNVIRPRKGVNVTDVWLGRPWHGEPKTVFINTQTFINIPAKGWYNTMGGLPTLWADYNTVDANGNPLDLSQRETYYYYTDSNTGQKVEKFNVKNYLTDEEAAQYTIKNVCGGDDNWQPDLMCEACDAPAVTLANGKLTWQPVPYAICYVITCNDEVIGFTTDTEYDNVQSSMVNGQWKVQAVNEFGGLSKYGVANDDTTTGIHDNVHSSMVNGQCTYDLCGRQIANSKPSAQHKSFVIVRQSDGTIHKMIR